MVILSLKLLRQLKEMSRLWSWLTIDSHAASFVLVPAVVPRGKSPTGVTTSLRFACWYWVALPSLKWNIQRSWRHITTQPTFQNVRTFFEDEFLSVGKTLWVYYFCSKQKYQTSTLTLIQEETSSDVGHVIHPNNLCITLDTDYESLLWTNTRSP